MIPYLYVIDNTFGEHEFGLLREYAHQLTYEDREGPDGVTYRGIGLPIPRSAEELLIHGFSWLLGYKVTMKICAFRLSLEGTRPPQWAHSDAQVAKYAAFTYINPGPGGTVMLRHIRTGMFQHPRNEEELAAWRKDHSDLNEWEMTGSIDCQPNRTVIMRAEIMHGAMPPNGFGNTPQNGRLILWSFFD